jgi:phosphoglycolate phosphatase
MKARESHVRHLFFDLDGTLTDPAPGIGACLLHAARALGHTALSEADIRRYIGPPLRDCFAELLATTDPARIEEAVRLYRERFSDVGIFENSVYPGISRALSRLRQAGHPLHIVTSKPAVYADRIVDHFGLREHFPRVYGAELSGALGTKSELVALAIDTERIEPAQACMIGDREHDVFGAKAHDVLAIGVTWGYGSRAELEAAGADHVVDSFTELLDVIGRLPA